MNAADVVVIAGVGNDITPQPVPATVDSNDLLTGTRCVEQRLFWKKDHFQVWHLLWICWTARKPSYLLFGSVSSVLWCSKKAQGFPPGQHSITLADFTQSRPLFIETDPYSVVSVDLPELKTAEPRREFPRMWATFYSQFCKVLRQSPKIALIPASISSLIVHVFIFLRVVAAVAIFNCRQLVIHRTPQKTSYKHAENIFLSRNAIQNLCSACHISRSEPYNLHIVPTSWRSPRNTSKDTVWPEHTNSE